MNFHHICVRYLPFLTITFNDLLKTEMLFSFTAFFIYEQYAFRECLTVVKGAVLIMVSVITNQANYHGFMV